MDVDLSRVARHNREAAVPPGSSRAASAVKWADDRLGLAKLPKLMSLRKVFPDHWSFMLGEIALWSFVVLLITGIFLTFWFDPSMAEVQYQGSYDALRGVPMSAAYASTLDMSFDVRGGLLMRQMHHWAAHIFIAAMMIHLLRHALTGSFRKPREVNWLIGTMLLLFGTLNGFLGYSLPDDLLSGTGLRAFDGFLKATPVVGSLPVVPRLRRRVPGRPDHLALLHLPRPPGPRTSLGAGDPPPDPGDLPQAHAMAWSRTYRAQCGRCAVLARVHRQGWGVLPRRLRRHRTDGRSALHQQRLEVRPVRPLQGDCRFATGLVHGLGRRSAADHAAAGDPRVGRDDLVEHPDPPGRAGDPADGCDAAAVRRGMGHRRQAGAPLAAAPARRPDPDCADDRA